MHCAACFDVNLPAGESSGGQSVAPPGDIYKSPSFCHTQSEAREMQTLAIHLLLLLVFNLSTAILRFLFCFG